MSGSRRILLALLLASVTCVVVVQVTLDNRNSRGAMTYADDVLKPERILLAEQVLKSSPPTKPAVIKGTVIFSNASSTTSKKATIPLTTVPFKISEKIQPVKNRRRIPLVKSSRHKQQYLINRNDRIQEILRQGGGIRAKSIVDPMKTLNTMSKVNSQNVTRIFIVTYFRAGSSFFGDLLQQNWKTFYQFEPLHSMTYDSRIGDDKLADAFKLFNGIFRCNSSDLKDYFQWVIKPRNQFLFAHNIFLWATCRSSIKTCFNPKFVDAVCQRAPVHVMKVTRLHMRQLRIFLGENPDLNIKVVYLTRDPRGIVSSRWNLDWCNDTQCSDPGILCREMADDIKVFEELQKKDPSNFIKVRYEDLSLNPDAESKRLFQFLNLPFTLSVKRFLKTHTVGRRTDNKNPYSTRRNSTAMAFSWRERFTFEKVEIVQATCDGVLRNLNYSFITSPNQLPFPQGIPKKNYLVRTPQNQEHFHRSKLLNGAFNTNTNLPAMSVQIKNYPITRNDKVNNPKLIENKMADISMLNHMRAISPNLLNNTKIEVHKVFYVLPSISPKNESTQTNVLR